MSTSPSHGATSLPGAEEAAATGAWTSAWLPVPAAEAGSADAAASSPMQTDAADSNPRKRKAELSFGLAAPAASVFRQGLWDGARAFDESAQLYDVDEAAVATAERPAAGRRKEAASSPAPNPRSKKARTSKSSPSASASPSRSPTPKRVAGLGLSANGVAARRLSTPIVASVAEPMDASSAARI